MMESASDVPTGAGGTTPAAARDAAARLNRRAATASVSVATILMGLKLWGAWSTGSVAMLGSAADTALDLLASGITLYSVQLAARPADDDHRFGHGKAEAIAALLQVVMIAVSAAALMFQAIRQLVMGARPEGAEGGIAISVVAILLTLLLLFYQRRVIARTGSVAIGADHVHYQSDLLLNIAVIVALALASFTNSAWIDPLFGILIALWLGWGGWRASLGALDQLMDREWPVERRARLVAVTAGHPEFDGLHELRTRTSGSHDFAQFHIWVDPQMTIAAAHDLTEALEKDIAREFPGVEVLIHLDPRGHLDHPDEQFETL